MLIVDSDNNIKLTRGDTAILTLSVTRNGSEYDFSSDLVQFTVKRNTVTEDIVIQKTFSGTSITINPSDTKNLQYTDLKYDVQIINSSNEVYTVITPHDFILTEEVNFNVTRT